jgi:phosphate transport system permease protein
MMLQNNKAGLRKRARAEWRFRSYGILSLLFAGAALVFLVSTIVSSGHSAFFKTTIELEFQLDAERLGIETPYTREHLWAGSYYTAAKSALYALFPEVTSRPDKRALSRMLSPGAELELRDYVVAHPGKIGETVTLEVPVSSDYDQLYKGHLPRSGKHTRLSAQQMEQFDRLVDEGLIHYRFNPGFLTGADSRYPELAGIGGALAGSFYALLVCFLLSFPLGIAAALYLEEFSKDSRLTRLIEANINNLAAVPSVIFGLLGLAVILNVFGLPRGTPLVGGMVLALMTLPTIIIACRSSLRAVSPGIRQGALAMGASPVQVVFQQVLPAAMPGTLTGTIIGLAQALGETAPLLMIGMVAFIANVPATPLDSSASLPVQIYLWAESAERGFVEKTAAAIIVIMIFLILMNLLAVIIRSRTQTKVE